MEIPSLMKLHLRAPLVFSEIPLRDGEMPPESSKDEYLFCYKLNLQQSKSIEPEKERFLDAFVFSGRKLIPNKNGIETETTSGKITEKTVSLPQGIYLFMQKRAEKPLTKSEWLDLAIEQQKDGLWEREKPEAMLYVRFLYEDEAFVTQVIRQVGCDSADSENNYEDNQ